MGGTPETVAVDAHYMYWSTSGGPAGNAIGRANLDGSGTVTSWIHGLAAYPSGIATDASYICWVDGSQYIGRATLDGQTVVPHFIDAGAGEALQGVAISSRELYVSDDHGPGRILSVPASGGSPTPVITAAHPSDLFTGVAAGADRLFWGVLSGAGSSIASAPLANLANANFQYVPGLAAPIAVAVDSSFVYWSDAAFTALQLGRAPLGASAAGPPTYDWISEPNLPGGIAVDSLVDPTTTRISCLTATVTVGATTTCAATVTDSTTSSIPSGTVSFSGGSGAVVLGNPCTLGPIAGVQTCTVGIQLAQPGTATITAAYGGDGVHQQSTGTAQLCAGTASQCGSPSGGGGGSGGGGSGGSGGSGDGGAGGGGSRCIVPRLIGESVSRARGARDRGLRARQGDQARRPREPLGRGARRRRAGRAAGNDARPGDGGLHPARPPRPPRASALPADRYPRRR